MRFDLHDYRPGVLVLDMQRLFTRADGPFGNPAGAVLCAAVNGLLTACSPFGLPVLVSRYVLADDAGDAGLLAGDPVVSGGFFGASSPWAQNDPALRLPAASVHLQRNRPGAFHGGELEAALAATGVDALILCGLSVNNAISTTAREAFARDIPAIVVREAAGAAPGETHTAVYFDVLDTWTAAVMTQAALVEALAARTGV